MAFSHEKVDLDKALVLIGGKIVYGGSHFPTERYFVNRNANLDESHGEQLEQVFDNMNAIYTVVNQHACILNGHSLKFTGLPSVSEIKSALLTVGSSQDSGQRPDFASGKKHSDGKTPDYLQPLSQRLQSIESMLDKMSGSISQTATSIEDLEEKMNKRLMACALVDEVKRERRESDLKLSQELRKEVDAMTKRVEQFEQRIVEKEKHTEQKIGEFSKETIWKIEDCHQLLKLRPTEEVVLTLNKELESKLLDFMQPRSPAFEKGAPPYKTEDGFPQTSGLSLVNSRLLFLENKYPSVTRLESLASSKSTAAAADTQHIQSLMERLDNDHLKFNDFQTSIFSNQQRLETLFELIKSLEKQVFNFSTVDHTVNSRIVELHISRTG